MLIKCYYSVVRYVPNSLRDESINLGVVLEAYEEQPRQKLYRFVENYHRAAKIDPKLKGAMLERAIKPSLERVATEADNTNFTLSDIIANFAGGRVQLTQPRLAMTKNLEAELEKLYGRFVVEEKDERQHGISETSLKKDVRNVFVNHGIDARRLEYGTPQRPLLVEGKKARHEFDFKVRVNGFFDLMRCISFDVEDYEAKVNAAKELVYEANDVKERREKANIISILQPPTRLVEEDRVSAFKDAREILRGEGVLAFDFASRQDRGKLLALVEEHISHAK